MASQNGIIGDENYGTDIPVTEVNNEQLQLEKNLAKFSKSKEYAALREHMQERIRSYQTSLPDGRGIQDRQRIPTPEEWVIANKVISEFQAVLDTYENAAKAVAEAEK